MFVCVSPSVCLSVCLCLFFQVLALGYPVACVLGSPRGLYVATCLLLFSLFLSFWSCSSNSSSCPLPLRPLLRLIPSPARYPLRLLPHPPLLITSGSSLLASQPLPHFLRFIIYSVTSHLLMFIFISFPILLLLLFVLVLFYPLISLPSYSSSFSFPFLSPPLSPHPPLPSPSLYYSSSCQRRRYAYEATEATVSVKICSLRKNLACCGVNSWYFLLN